ncbi:MAG: hypothetical protein ACI9OD_000283 [Limisphaerales bacterium]|jgi:hypothetical protein
MRRTNATSESVANKIFDTIRADKPPLRVPATIDARLFSLLRRVLPRRIYHSFLYRCLPKIAKWGRGKNQPGGS